MCRSKNVEFVNERPAADVGDRAGGRQLNPEQCNEGELPWFGQLASNDVLDGVPTSAFACN